MGEGKKILLVEDNSDDILLTKRALTKSNILNEVIVAHDGVKALDYLFGRGEWKNRDITDTPEVILLDLNMPKMGGLEALREIRQHDITKFLPVIILTTSIEESDIVEGYSLGANSYICKPVDFNQFHEAIKHLGLYWLVLNQNPNNRGNQQ